MPTSPEAMVAIVLDNGCLFHVDVDASVGPFIIHRRIWAEQLAPDGWTVTHRATTFAVWTVFEYADAVKVAQWLDKQNVIPSTTAGVEAWRAKTTRVELTRLMVQLQELAPRYRGGGVV